MLLTLMRHGIAESFAGSDANRALTPSGAVIVREVVRGLHAGGWLPGSIVCSPLVRARQTAALIEARFPGLPTEVLTQAIHTAPDLLEQIGRLGLVDPIIVGHNPGISRLAGELIGAGHLPFEPATVACYRLDGLPPREHGQLLWFAPPNFARCFR